MINVRAVARAECAGDDIFWWPGLVIVALAIGIGVLLSSDYAEY